MYKSDYNLQRGVFYINVSQKDVCIFAVHFSK